MSNGASVALGAKKRLFDDAVALFGQEKVQVSFGHPGRNRQFDDIVALTGIRTEQDAAGMGPGRSRREHLYLTVMVSCWRAGVDDDLAPTEAVYSYANRLEQYVRTTDPTLGGLALWCFLDEHTSDGLTDRQMLAKGRLIEGAFIFHALATITGAAA
jgi:hypothetical protein